MLIKPVSVPINRTISTTAPLNGGGGLSGNLTLTISPADDSNPGSMSAAHYVLVNDATDANTASTIVKRDASGDFSAGVVSAGSLSTSLIVAPFESVSLGTNLNVQGFTLSLKDGGGTGGGVLNMDGGNITMNAGSINFGTGSINGVWGISMGDSSVTLNMFGATITNAGDITSTGKITGGSVGVGTTTLYSNLQSGAWSASIANVYVPSSSGFFVCSTNNGGNSPSAPATALSLGRNGVVGESYNNAVDFKLSHYEVSGFDSRTRFDIALSHGATEATLPVALSLFSNGDATVVGTLTAVDLFASDSVQNGITVGLRVENIATPTVSSVQGPAIDLGGQNGSVWGRIAALAEFGQLYSSLRLYSQSAGSLVEAITIDPSGQVGIKNPTPGVTLDVGGNANATAYLVGGSLGWTGTYATGDSRTVTVTGGIITDVS